MSRESKRAAAAARKAAAAAKKAAAAKNATNTSTMNEPKPTTGSVKEPTEAEREAKRQVYLQSDTYKKVNAVNRETKEYSRTLKGARSLLLNAKADQMNSMTANFQTILRATKKSQAVWDHMQENVRVYSSGKVGTHVILQWCKKYEDELLELVKSGK